MTQRKRPGESDPELSGLLRRYSAVQADGFAIDLASAPGRWDRCMKRLGTGRACGLMAVWLCRTYGERFGEPFLLTEACVSREIRYHVEAYLAAMGYKPYTRPATTLPYTREAIKLHCGEINISLEDLTDWKQRLVFRYRKGIRDVYRRTERDPYHR